MDGRGKMLQKLGRRRGAAIIALYALVVEIVFGSIHAAALAAAAFGPASNLDSLVFQICTPQGITTRAPDSKAPSNSNSDSSFCPVCNSAAVSFFTHSNPLAVPAVVQASLLVKFSEIVPCRYLTAWRGHKIRAPPC